MTNRRRELFIPARISDVHTYDPGEVRKVTLTLPDAFEVDGRSVPVRDRMRPGAAFLAQPFGVRTQKPRRRMYSRSNGQEDGPRVLETIINDTHQEKADTSPWWQTDEPERLFRTGGFINVRVDYDDARSELVVYQNSETVERNNLILESDQTWPTMKIVALALSTGLTPFLSYLSHMKAKAFGTSDGSAGGHVSLIVSVKTPRQLMEHQALLDLAREYPRRFFYHPVLTREWPDDWPHAKGRILRVETTDGDEERVNLDPLMALAPTLHQCHVRFCGNATARDQLVRGFRQANVSPLSFRAEAW